LGTRVTSGTHSSSPSLQLLPAPEPSGGVMMPHGAAASAPSACGGGGSALPLATSNDSSDVRSP
jgi:hypothetical protein